MDRTSSVPVRRFKTLTRLLISSQIWRNSVAQNTCPSGLSHSTGKFTELQYFSSPRNRSTKYLQMWRAAVRDSRGGLLTQRAVCTAAAAGSSGRSGGTFGPLGSPQHQIHPSTRLVIISGLTQGALPASLRGSQQSGLKSIFFLFVVAL